jgi:two-component system, cell cycle response regulator
VNARARTSYGIVNAALAALALGVLAHGLHGAGVLGGSDSFFVDWLYTGLQWGTAAICVARVVVISRDRLAWLAFSAYLVLSAVGDLTWTVHFNHFDEAPYPNWSDAIYLASYPCGYAGMLLLLRSRLRPFRASLWLDGAVGGLALAALTTALLFGPALSATEGDATTVAVTLAYPVADLLLLCCAGLGLGLTGWRPGRAWGFIIAGLVLTAVGDAVYSYTLSAGTYEPGALIDTLWPASSLAIAAGAWQRRGRGGAETKGYAVLVAPVGFALVALAVLLYGWVEDLPPVAGGLAAAGLLAAMGRGVLTFRENIRILQHSRDEALSDGLSGLPNRRKLLIDLEEALDDASDSDGHTLTFFDLDGFKSYNDTFGHYAGDALLARLGRGLRDAVAGHGTAYRLGGDEFCVLVERTADASEALIAQAAQALYESGEGFTVTASHGTVELPAEADTSETALQIADERMYEHKDSRREAGSRQARDVLVQVLAEREPELRRHMAQVADLALSTALELGLSPEEAQQVARAAELHDIGKVAVPDDIIHKPGSLDDVEWHLMRQHTLIGERILATAPTLRSVAKLVRWSHERWDGGGYPDDLSGDEIPIGARIIAVCDAYDAMTSERAYSRPRTPEEAMAELQRCAGHQFDPVTVAAFCVAAPRATDRRRAEESAAAAA